MTPEICLSCEFAKALLTTLAPNLQRPLSQPPALFLEYSSLLDHLREAGPLDCSNLLVLKLFDDGNNRIYPPESSWRHGN